MSQVSDEMLSNGGGASYQTVGEIWDLLRSSVGNGHQHDIPTEFFVPESCRPMIPFDATGDSDNPVPVLDLADVDHCGGQLAAKLTEMCEEWGFVQVINHGVPLHIIRGMASFGHSFFALPTEHKKRAALSHFNGYRGFQRLTQDIGAGVGADWAEGLTMWLSPESNIAAMEAKIWPEHPNDAFRQTLQQFDAAMDKLEMTLLRLLAEGLGLEATFFSQHFDGTAKTKSVHFNYYPPCPDPSNVLGSLAHTDASCITVLFQDQVAGLQIQAKDGSWHPVQHIKDSLLVVLGDVFQGWSNGRIPAVLHRVVVNDKIPRLSILHANNPPGDDLLQPAPVGGASRYKAFYSKEYIAFKVRQGMVQRPDHPQRRFMDAYNATALPADVVSVSF